MGFFTTLLVILPLLIIPAAFYRFLLISDPKRNKPIRHGRRNPAEPTHLLVVLGSGGHTAEMLAMLERAVSAKDASLKLDWKDYTHRTWVVGSGDSISAQRAKDFEDMVIPLSTPEDLMVGKVKRATYNGIGTYDVVTVPRAREIHQSLTTTPMSSFTCMRACYDLLTRYTTETRDGHASGPGQKDFPDVILCNGPATATILVATSMLLRFFDVKGCSTRGKLRTIYVESWARVKKPSLSGKLLSRVVDRFLVQWPQLERSTGGRAEFMGVLV
ncbi:hypothetical protein LTR36_005002 [Oleoguttula mirabilis]|uniref:UDP-N-acetylglucosamine transferase subunit ALG14 n=1 Tax=Oleoguttula mirabilis TaxID=1507867 RepID=A0AAV9JWJ1_9PEZI|nr:hypothetical protein LTR36_005002 [Oleoguttula mirabilis]